MNTLRRIPNRSLIGVMLLAGAAAVLILVWGGKRPQAAQLPDGTELVLRDVKAGLTNSFTHGTRLEKLLGTLIPTNGFRLQMLKLARPDLDTFGGYDTASLTFELEVTGSSNALAKSELIHARSDRKFRFVHWGDDGFKFTEEFAGRALKKHRNRFFLYVNTATFCRGGRELHLQLQSRDTLEDDNWRTLAAFSAANPAPVAAQHWQTEATPVVRRMNKDLEVILGEVRVQRPRNGAAPYHDIWQHVVYFPFQFYWRGEAATNWSVEHMAVEDSSGNYNRFGTFKEFTNGWTVFRAWRSATPTVPWKITGQITRDSGFAGLNIFTFDIPPAPVLPLKTNFAGIPATIDLVNVTMLAVNIPTNIPGVRIVFLDAKNENGESVDARTGSWGQYSFWRSLDLNKAKGTIHARVALAENFPFECVVQPVPMDQIRVPPAVPPDFRASRGKPK